jgi:hypothetical protein
VSASPSADPGDRRDDDRLEIEDDRRLHRAERQEEEEAMMPVA